MKQTWKRILATLLVAVMVLGVAQIGVNAANQYSKIPALQISRIYQPPEDHILCYWCSAATVEGYCLNKYTYGGVTSSYRNPGVDYNFNNKNDAVSKKMKTFSGYANTSPSRYPVPLTCEYNCEKNPTATYKKIYNLLAQGKPVAVYTGKHASVIIAYNGSSSVLEPKGFTVLEVKLATYKSNGKTYYSYNNSVDNYKKYANSPRSDSSTCYINLEHWMKSCGQIKQLLYPSGSVQAPSNGSTSNTPVFKTGIYKTNARGVRFRTQPGTSTNTTVIKEMPTGTTLTVTEIQSVSSYTWGKAVLDGRTGWFALDYADYIGPSIVKPSAPTINTSVSGDVAVGTSTTITWSANEANSYNVTVSCNGTAVKTLSKTTDKSLALPLETAGSYTVKVEANNAAGTGAATTKTNFIIAHAPSTVQFNLYDGTVISQTVKYGANAVQPEVPEREGYTFLGWDQSLNNIKGNLTVNAQYKIKSFNVNFLDNNGNQLTQTQTVEFGAAAAEPADKNVPTGYKFVGWSTDEYQEVKQNLNVHAIYGWENATLPVYAEITSATRVEDGYYVYFNLTNTPDAVTRGRAVISLKTAEDKLVDTTESAAFSIPKGGSKTGMEVFVPCTEPASIAELVIVNSYSSGVPISAVKTAQIQQAGAEWSEWSLSQPATGSYTELNTRTVYRYRDKQLTEGTAPTMDGWTQYSSEQIVGDYGSWSSWSKTQPASQANRRIESRTVTDQAAYTQYKLFYYRYYNPNYSTYYYTYDQATARSMDSNYKRYDITVNANELKFRKSYNSTYDGYVKSSGYYKFSNEVWYLNKTVSSNIQQIPAATHTEYRYADRTVSTKYYFYKWTAWSNWSADQIASSSTREVETATQYRYRNASLVSADENQSGELRAFSGVLDPSYAGKQAALFIYKIDEASDYTNEYVGQTIIDPSGAYVFTYKLREEPTAKTGDFTIALGIEGTSNTMIVGKIEAPKPEYTVRFYDYDGALLSEQTVTESENAGLPENPAREGYTFTGWSGSVTDVRRDLDLVAQYSINTYYVTFVDWENRNIENQTFEYGSLLATPTIDPEDIPEGKSFLGWQIDGVNVSENMTVSSDLIVEAVYETAEYSVVFHGIPEVIEAIPDLQTINDTVIKCDVVWHDDAVELVDDMIGEEIEAYADLMGDDYPDIIFMGWRCVGDNDFTQAKEDLELFPVYTFAETAETPMASVQTGDYDENQLITLFNGNDHAVIWYTLDGSDPTDPDNAIEYTGPFMINSSCVLHFYATELGKNDSEVVRELYAINTASTPIEYYIVSIETGLSDEAHDIYKALVRENTFFDDTELRETDIEGYVYQGLYFDSEFADEFIINQDIIDETMTLYAKYDAIQCTATFVDYDGRILKTETVNYGSEVSTPEVAARDGYVFIGWDSDAYHGITQDTTFTAQYVPEDEYATISFSRSKMKVMAGSPIILKPRITPASFSNTELAWSSDDETIATVEPDGTVNILRAGTVTITAMVVSTGASASVVITAIANADTTITLGGNSTLRYDSNGFLREIRAGHNTVEEVRGQFLTEDLRFFDINGAELNDTDLIGTGSRVRAYDGETMTDERQIIVTGDFDGDGNITVQDASHVSRYLVDKETAELWQMLAIDCNGDGRINVRDNSMIARYTVGKETW